MPAFLEASPLFSMGPTPRPTYKGLFVILFRLVNFSFPWYTDFLSFVVDSNTTLESPEGRTGNCKAFQTLKLGNPESKTSFHPHFLWRNGPKPLLLTWDIQIAKAVPGCASNNMGTTTCTLHVPDSPTCPRGGTAEGSHTCKAKTLN